MTSNHKTTTYWAERAIVPLHGFKPMVIGKGIGSVDGYTICISNHTNVEDKRKSDYADESIGTSDKLPIWC